MPFLYTITTAGRVRNKAGMVAGAHER